MAAKETGNGDARPQVVRCYGGAVAYGYDDEYDHGMDYAPPPLVSGMAARPDKYVYGEYDEDYKVFPAPGPGTVIESTGHGYTIVSMKTTCDGNGALPSVYDGQFACIASHAAAVSTGCFKAN